MAEMLKTSEQGRQSAHAGLKIAEVQAEDQRKRLYTTELDLATEKAAVLSLKAELEKAKVEAQAIREAAQAAKRAAYERGVLKTEQRLAKEVAEVCRDYCSMTWDAALNSARVPAKSELRKAERLFYPKHIRDILTDPSSAASPSFAFEQVPNTQGLPVDFGTSIGVGMGKEVPPLASDTPSEDVLTIKDVISQAKVVKKPRDEDLAKTTITKEDPPPKKK